MKQPKRKSLFGRYGEPAAIIVARGDDILRCFIIRPWMTVAAGSAMAFIAVLYLAATAYLVLRDDLIRAAAAHQEEIEQAYEERISALRAEVDRLTSHQLLGQQLMQRKMAELLRRQDRLTQRHSRLGPVIDRAEALSAGKEPLPTPTPRPDERAELDVEPPDRSIVTGSAFAGLRGSEVPWPIHDERKEDVSRGKQTNALLDALDRSLRDMETDQIARVERFTEEAYQATEKISNALAAAGIAIAGDYGEKSVGGPLLAASVTPFEEKVLELDEALNRLEEVKRTARTVPIANPLPNAAVTSAFGMRRDPFLGRLAYHSGMDFRGQAGTPVRATAIGTVIKAGWYGGYGRMVEIDHGNGLVTRYGHLSKILVKKGDSVEDGTVIGRIGSSGRSTGPHLHYEIRREGQAINPLKFLTIGRRIIQLL